MKVVLRDQEFPSRYFEDGWVPSSFARMRAETHPYKSLIINTATPTTKVSKKACLLVLAKLRRPEGICQADLSSKTEGPSKNRVPWERDERVLAE